MLPNPLGNLLLILKYGEKSFSNILKPTQGRKFRPALRPVRCRCANCRFILTAADNSKQALERTIEEFRGFTFCLDEPKEKGIIYGTGAWNIGDIKGSNAMGKALEMGKSV